MNEIAFNVTGSERVLKSRQCDKSGRIGGFVLAADFFNIGIFKCEQSNSGWAGRCLNNNFYMDEDEDHGSGCLGYECARVKLSDRKWFLLEYASA